MVLRACQATKKDVLDRTKIFLKKRKEEIKAMCLEEQKKFIEEIYEAIDLKKFHKFSMILH